MKKETDDYSTPLFDPMPILIRLVKKVLSKDAYKGLILLYLNGKQRIFVQNSLKTKKMLHFLKINDSISIARVRELLGISRKYIIPLLNKMDEEKITQRKENVRVLKTKLD